MFLQFQPRDCFAGGGIWHPEPPTLKRIRDFLADNPAAWKRATQGKAFREHFQFWGESLTRPPRGYPVDHELIEDLKRKSYAAGAQFTEAMACSSELRAFAIESFKRLTPMIDYLCAALDLEF